MAKVTWSGQVPQDDPMFSGGPQLFSPYRPKPDPAATSAPPDATSPASGSEAHAAVAATPADALAEIMLASLNKSPALAAKQRRLLDVLRNLPASTVEPTADEQPGEAYGDTFHGGGQEEQDQFDLDHDLLPGAQQAGTVDMASMPAAIQAARTTATPKASAPSQEPPAAPAFGVPSKRD
jgi:hypothetical protein